MISDLAVAVCNGVFVLIGIGVCFVIADEVRAWMRGEQ